MAGQEDTSWVEASRQVGGLEPSDQGAGPGYGLSRSF